MIESGDEKTAGGTEGMGKRGPRAFPAEGGGGPSQLPGDWLRRYALIESINERQWAQSIFGRGASGRAFCNVLFVKADDKYWPRSFAFARTYVTQAHSSVRTTAVVHARASIHAHAGYTHTHTSLGYRLLSLITSGRRCLLHYLSFATGTSY